MKVSTIYLTLFLTIVMLLSSCSNTETEDKYFYLKGTVKDAAGNPVENAIIQLAYDMDTLKSRADTISFALPYSQHVKLWITRKSDNEIVKTLLDTNLSAGLHSTSWNLKNQSGKYVRNGIYMFYLKTDSSGTISKKVHLRDNINSQTYAELDYYAKSNQKGQFQIDLSQLAVGESFETDDSLVFLTISPNVKIWAILPDNSRSVIKTIKVQPNTDTSTDINFAK